ncbi:acireductone synthase [Pseudomonas sp. C27(2019)]|uniref:acireductone synthase n=1 Tax=Pseudomonas sp. C27(2019) TaxID=2604941 RepID=UPI001244E6C1|nr:acireductone synthase [Pseudomonas sp. C27(2019)]QEY58724.1 acireductone synthase [Pseudomonas sp. C27(2019)]
MSIKAILTDIEGTTSSIAFVYEVLFPYAKLHLPDYVRACAEQEPQAQLLQAVRDEAQEPQADVERVIAILLQWMEGDVKATSLKTLQGLVWQQGYETGEIKGHVYPDAVTALHAWQQHGYALYVYSSGSVQAQKLIFGYSVAGDLTPLFSGYFDTTSGHKREQESYARIAQALDLPAEHILFLSDVVEELDAAQASGMRTCGLARNQGVLAGHVAVENFAQIDPAAF